MTYHLSETGNFMIFSVLNSERECYQQALKSN